MNFGIIGFGLMGQRWARELFLMPGHSLVAVYDPDAEKSRSLLSHMEYFAEPSYEKLLGRDDIDVVIIAVPHFKIHDITVSALQAGKHVLCEKPLGLNTKESGDIIQTVQTTGLHLCAGFNYRFYPGIQYIRRIISMGRIGKPTHLRCVLGHGARPGYNTEWKTQKSLCGGGALLDPGIHIIDLIRFLLGDVKAGALYALNTYWNNIDVEDNAFVILKTESGLWAQLNISFVEWKNRFSLEIFGSDGYVNVQGRYGSYGPQVVRLGRRWGWLETPPQSEVVTEFGSEDRSLSLEMQAFCNRIAGKEDDTSSRAEDGKRALEIVERLYKAGNGRFATV